MLLRLSDDVSESVSFKNVSLNFVELISLISS